VQPERHVERVDAFEPDLHVLAVLFVGRPDERGDPEPAGRVVEEAPEARPDVVVEQPLDVAGDDRGPHASVR
jgi:hypothetical protein